MRSLLVACLFIVPAVAHAQEQERKLIDRLLKPDMTLQNDAQGKKFTAGGQIMEKKAPMKLFFFRQRSVEKEFAGGRTFATKTVAPQEFARSDQKAKVPSTGWASNARTYRTGPAWAVGQAPGADKTVDTRAYATRPFLGRGKSQKALSQHDTPLTVDQVRELLNKNK